MAIGDRGKESNDRIPDVTTIPHTEPNETTSLSPMRKLFSNVEPTKVEIPDVESVSWFYSLKIFFLDD